MEKRCKVCRQLKPLDEFYKAPGMRDGHRNDCKSCNGAASAERHRRNPGPARERAKRWRLENPERYAENQRRTRESGSKKLTDRRGHLKRTFGITLEQYEAMLAAQHGGCAICGKPARDDIALHVDHGHDTGRVRGLPCFDCNAGLGKLREDRELLRAAERYLDDHDPEVQEVVALGRKRAASLARR
jgi:hypothetical protein